jgi:hypothetical protein
VNFVTRVFFSKSFVVKNNLLQAQILLAPSSRDRSLSSSPDDRVSSHDRHAALCTVRQIAGYHSYYNIETDPQSNGNEKQSVTLQLRFNKLDVREYVHRDIIMKAINKMQLYRLI